MKILFCNYRFFVSGGPERYMFNLIDELNARGHQIIPFSIKYDKNIKSTYENYFVDPLGNQEQIYFRDQNSNLKSIYRTIKRLFYDRDVEHAIVRLIKDTKPQIAFILHYLRKLSPAILVGIKKMGLPIIVRLSDYMMVCPGIHCIRKERPCDLCITGDLIPSIRYRCVQNSVIASSLNALAVQYYRSKRFFDLIDMFVVTNEFMYKLMLKAGYPENKLRIIPTFVNSNNVLTIKNEILIPMIAFVGRLEEIKGVHVLLNAVIKILKINPTLTFKVKIAGSGDFSYIQKIKSIINNNNLQRYVTLLGELNRAQITDLYQSALISVVPSIWFENLPNSILESFGCGTPVIGSDLGSLSLVISDKNNGLLFEPGNADDLAHKIIYCIENRSHVMKMGENAMASARYDYSPKIHVGKLLSLFNEWVI